MEQIEEQKTNPVSIVTIKEKIDIFKGEEKAENIELILLEENGFTLISQKNLYQIGDKAVYIQPDYCLSDIPLFESFLRPLNKDGVPDESKSMLGKVGGLPRRIRAKKFNFHRGDGEIIYSNGILLPTSEVEKYLEDIKYKHVKFSDFNLKNFDLAEELDITKYEEPESNKGGINTGKSKPFPPGLYKTDEENVNNMWNHIENRIGYPITLIGTEKVDGCLDGNTLIQTNEGKFKIQDLVNNEKKLLILTYNIEEDKNEYSILKNTLVQKNINNWYKITLEDDSEIIITDNHPVFLPKLNCYRKVSDLTEGDVVLKN